MTKKVMAPIPPGPVGPGDIDTYDPYTPYIDDFEDNGGAKHFIYPSSYENGWKMPTNKSLFVYNNSVLLSLSNFKDERNKTIKATGAVNDWDVKEPTEFIDKENNNGLDFLARGSFVNFSLNTRLLKADGGWYEKPYVDPDSGMSYTLSYRIKRCKIYVDLTWDHEGYYDYFLVIEKIADVYDNRTNEEEEKVWSKSFYPASYFADKILPRRLIVIVQGGGGGGGSAWGDEGKNGAGGGSGGFFACVINTELLWKSPKYKYIIEIGAKGEGGVHITGTKATAGGDSILKIQKPNTVAQTLLKAGGGQGGASDRNGDGGAGGIVTDGSGTNLYDIIAINGLNKYFWWLPYSHNRSWEHGLAGRSGKPGSTNRPSSPAYYLYNVPADYPAIQDLDNNYKQVGGKLYGITHNWNGGGAGAASYFGQGGNSGPWGSGYGEAPKEGFGGGGGGATYVIIVGRPGGDGAPGCVEVYAYGE